MGKDEEQPPQEEPQSAGVGCRAKAVARLRCVAALLFGLAVLLSAVFWLPPLHGGWRLGGGGEGGDGGFDGADIVASFKLQRSATQLKENIRKLELDIYEEIGGPNATVVVYSLEPAGGSEWTTVVFNVVPYPLNSTLYPTYMSVLKSYFTSLVINQSTLHLTEALFGNASFFEILKFPGGITIIPEQIVFVPQKPHASFNFSLNYPIYMVQNETDQLKDQMKSGLLLYPYENLYVKLTNLEGSTVDPPTIVQTIIVLEVGTHQSSVPRLKQLAQTIANSSSGNLGLNHTVFGRVKEISLSSYLQHSLNSRGSSPSPAPQPHVDQHHHHNHHHHNNGDKRHVISSVPAPAPMAGHRPSFPPSGCQYRYIGKPKTASYLSPSPEPVVTHEHPASPVRSHHYNSIAPSSPHKPHSIGRRHINPAPTPPPVLLHKASPMAAASFSHSYPPSESVSAANHPGGIHLIAPAPHTSTSSGHPNCHAITRLLPLLTIFLLVGMASTVFAA